MLKNFTCASLFALPLLLSSLPSHAIEGLGIDQCIQKHPAIEHTLLSAFTDQNPQGNRPSAYYQIGAILTRENGYKVHVPYLVVKHTSGTCQAFKINPYQGYEPLVPGEAAIDMEVHHFNWEEKNARDIPPREEWISIDPAEIGHGCEDIPQAQAAAMRRIKYEYKCPVREKKFPLIWDQ